ncbi:YggS family pyridoxal phosphate-dependent enzyme [Salisediminibacterium selenitireducens]|uniref:YggS family pyridoxal phosphate-dependent enzyme n=1 Tax=Salisediminibacterium selenitireducens TaxID=85683 RepID=UPI0005A09272|nr:YggS family pyridoxal phosphate-dependent enzyme [Salisediminibacterium selenitireducens]
MTVSKQLADVKAKIKKACERSGRQEQDVHIIAVTKYVTTERAIEAVDAGVRHVGENRVEDYREKYDEIGTRAEWHFIGSLQSKKVKKMINEFDYLHSLDRLSLAKELDKRAEGKKVKCFVQVNVSGESSKAGISPSEVLPFIKELEQYQALEVSGLMTMAPLTENESELRHVFSELRKLRDLIQAESLPHAPCKELSMGMSNDYEIAVEEGATFVRIGSALVGSE